jgi:hypothetical protein
MTLQQLYQLLNELNNRKKMFSEEEIVIQASIPSTISMGFGSDLQFEVKIANYGEQPIPEGTKEDENKMLGEGKEKGK